MRLCLANHSDTSTAELVVVVDCSDLARSADFWARVLGYVPDGPAVGPYLGLIPADGQGVEILLQRVPERKHGKNRFHLDLRTPDFDAEVRRVVGLGASLLTSQPTEEYGCCGNRRHGTVRPLAPGNTSALRGTPGIVTGLR